MYVVVFLVMVLLCAPAAPARAQGWSPSRPDAHAPLGVMGDHMHEAGEFMLSFRYMRMAMDGNLVDGDEVTTDAVLAGYPVTPLAMPMHMVMIGAMYAPSDRITVMGMVPVLGMSMDHRTRMGGEFTTESGGAGDVKASALVALGSAGRQRWHLNLGIGLPTGSIDERDDTPAATNVRLPYPMQVGSGTVDLMPGLTWLGQGDRWSWGAQGIATFRTGENDNGYTLGDRFVTTAWVSRVVMSSLSASARLGVDSWGNVTGADPLLNPMMVPTADPDLRGGTQVDLGFGVNLYAPSGSLAGHRLALEVSVPVVRRLDGPQLGRDWALTLGWQKSFSPRP